MITITLEAQDLIGRPATHIQLRGDAHPGLMVSTLVVHSPSAQIYNPARRAREQVARAVEELLERWAEGDE